MRRMYKTLLRWKKLASRNQDSNRMAFSFAPGKLIIYFVIQERSVGSNQRAWVLISLELLWLELTENHFRKIIFKI